MADPEIDFADLRRDAFLRDNLAERSDLIHSLPWVEDGLVLSERRAVQGLIYLAIYGGNTFFDLLGGEWVLAGENKPAIETLGTLARRDQKAFQRIVEHPTIKDGISDDEADVVATLWGVHRYAPDLVDKLLDPDRVQVERGTITLPLAGDVDIAIIRTRRGNEHTLELLGNAARFIEEFMVAPFPQPDFNYLFEQATSPSFSSSGFSRGNNSWTNITTKPEVDSAEYSWTQAYRHFVHETAHFYWRDGQRWINEGAATFLEAVAEHETTGSPLALERGPCSYARTIGELETLDPERTDRASVCYYILGERVFHDLYRSLDETAFRHGFRTLYLLSRFDDPADKCQGTKLNACHVRTAFATNASEETTATVDQVIDRWYHGTEPYDLSRIVDIPAEPELPQIAGRVEQAYLTHRYGDSAISEVSPDQDWLRLNLLFSAQTSSSYRLPLTIVEAYEDGFGYRAQTKTLSPGDRGEETAWVSRPSSRVVGRHWVIVYDGDRKVAQVEYEVTP